MFTGGEVRLLIFLCCVLHCSKLGRKNKLKCQCFLKTNLKSHHLNSCCVNSITSYCGIWSSIIFVFPVAQRTVNVHAHTKYSLNKHFPSCRSSRGDPFLKSDVLLVAGCAGVFDSWTNCTWGSHNQLLLHLLSLHLSHCAVGFSAV